jgi:DNA primase
MAFPESFLDDVRRSADIVRVISDHVSLRKVGNSWKGLCPFHQEKSPSFNVRSDPAVFHCFGCGEGGDVFRFVMLYEMVGFPEAVRTIAGRFGIPLPADQAAPDLMKGEREELLTVLEAAAQHFTQVLWSTAGTAAREYLLGRGFEKHTLEQIRAGASREAWGDLVDGLRRRFALPLLVKAGLAIERNDGKGAYDRFRNRAIFPITNESGKVVGFGARSLDGSEPKYLNSPETPVYQKSRTLYGLSWAKDALRRENSLILMEGYLDVARALEKGVGSAVATCGTALTASHARLLRRFTERVFVNFDQDSAGQRAAQKSIDVLLDEGLRVHVVQLPAGHDPDTYLKEYGGDAYRTRLTEAPSYMQWLIDRAAQENDTTTPEGKGRYLNALLPTLSRIENAVERAAWLPAVVERGRLEGRAAQEELRRAVAARATAAPTGATQPAAPRKAPALLPAERLLLVQLLSGKEGAGGALLTLDDEDVAPLRSADVLRAAQKLQSQGTTPTLVALESTVTEDEQRLLRELALSTAPAGGQSPAECARALKESALARRLADVQQRLEKAAGDDKLETLLSEEKMRLKLLQRKLERPLQES